MPRDIPVGNGSMLVTFDSGYQIRDIYYPYVGSENHTIGHPCRMGIWVDGHYSWVDSEWQKTLTYKTDTLVTDVKAKNDRLKIDLQMYDTVDAFVAFALRSAEGHNMLLAGTLVGGVIAFFT